MGAEKQKKQLSFTITNRNQRIETDAKQKQQKNNPLILPAPMNADKQMIGYKVNGFFITCLMKCFWRVNKISEHRGNEIRRLAKKNSLAYFSRVVRRFPSNHLKRRK